MGVIAILRGSRFAVVYKSENPDLVAEELTLPFWIRRVPRNRDPVEEVTGPNLVLLREWAIFILN